MQLGWTHAKVFYHFIQLYIHTHTHNHNHLAAALRGTLKISLEFSSFFFFLFPPNFGSLLLLQLWADPRQINYQNERLGREWCAIFCLSSILIFRAVRREKLRIISHPECIGPNSAPCHSHTVARKIMERFRKLCGLNLTTLLWSFRAIARIVFAQSVKTFPKFPN